MRAFIDLLSASDAFVQLTELCRDERVEAKEEKYEAKGKRLNYS